MTKPSRTIRALVLHPNKAYCEEIIRAFREEETGLELTSLTDLRQARTIIEHQEPDLAILGIDSPNDIILRTARQIKEGAKELEILVVSRQPTQELLLECMRAGADEFLRFPLESEEFAAALQRLLGRRGLVSRQAGKVIAVYSPKGGSGVTTIACNLGVNIGRELADRNDSCILDLNLQFGGVAVFLDVRQFTHTVADAARDAERLDPALLDSYLATHHSGARILPAPLQPDEVEDVSPTSLSGVIEQCKNLCKFVILDLPHKLDDHTVACLDAADEIFLLCDMLVPTIRNTIHAMEVMRQLDYGKDKVKLIVNRYYDSEQISLAEVQEHIQLPVHWVVPYDSPAAITSANAGQTFDETDPSSEVSLSLMALAQHTAGLVVEQKKPTRFALFKRG